MSPEEFSRILRQTLDDRSLSTSEKRALRELLAEAALDERQRAALRHEAFETARRALADPRATEVLEWLEDVTKLLLPSAGNEPEAHADAFFSPGEECPLVIIEHLDGARKTAELCVFTITDDRIVSAILRAHRRGVVVRIISDNEKAYDLGSDVPRLQREGIPLIVDQSPYHMHHKFAIFDERILLNGSYNWTRGAAENNEENIVISNDPALVRGFRQEFERLWVRLGQA